MGHEQSETVQRNGKWINVYGRNLKSAGRKLPGSGEFNSMAEAVAAAKKRSDSTVTIGPSPKRKNRSMNTGPRRRAR